MIIAVPTETSPGETRVAATPDTVKKYFSRGLRIRVQSGAGLASGFADEAYRSAGAEIMQTAAETINDAAVVIKIKSPLPEEISLFRNGQILIGDMEALSHPAHIKELSEKGLTCLALDLLPRISRTQNMDILSSQSSLSGYRAVIEAMARLSRAVPLMMTAAGTVTPARVLVLGAGVAGLQAIATAKRMGAVVTASDVRPTVKEQVESLGGRFLEIQSNEQFESTGGYAGKTSATYRKLQQTAISRILPQTDILITTALIPGKPAPRLVTRQMIEQLPAGAVIVDMAAATGGNVEGSQNKQTLKTERNVVIIGNSDLAAKIPFTASSLFANNIYNFLDAYYQSEKKKFEFNDDDEIIRAVCAARNGNLLI